MATKKRRLDRTELDGQGVAVEIDGAADGANGHAESEIVPSRPERRGAKSRDREHAPFTLPPLDPDLYINRELSWLEFNRRVLDRARDPETPLLERAKFASIFCSNLDEFFMIRVAGLERKLSLGNTDPGFDGRTPSAVFTLVKRTVQEMLDHHASLVDNDLLPALAGAGIHILPHRRPSGR